MAGQVMSFFCTKNGSYFDNPRSIYKIVKIKKPLNSAPLFLFVTIVQFLVNLFWSNVKINVMVL
jgi:hypothetical protein